MSGRSRSRAQIDYAASRLRTCRETVLDGSSRRRRVLVVAGFACLWAVLLVGRLFSLQISDYERWQDWALKEHFKEIVVASERGPIVDRNGSLMAVSVPAGSVYVRPRQVKNREETARELARLLDMPVKEVSAKLASSQPFVWVKRQIPRPLAEQIEASKLPGVGQVLESKRYYPYNHAASTLIGMVGVDGTGMSGLERKYEDLLHREHSKALVTRDAYGNLIDVNASGDSHFSPPKGDALKLTLDSGIQMIMEEELATGRKDTNSKAAMAVMIDADTGDVLGMSQAPGVNFNGEAPKSKKRLHNLIVESVFEPGSIMKPMVASVALQMGVLRPDNVLDCENGNYHFGKHVIRDVHPSGLLSLHDVVVRSSNIGMSKVGLKIGRQSLHDSLKNYGFGMPSGLGLPGETDGILRPLSSWAEVDVATHSFGQGVAVTPLQIVRAMAAIANGGRVPSLKLVDDGSAYESKRVISEEVAAQVREMLYGVVEDEHGTGQQSKIEGVRIGGKTGTAQKSREGGRGYVLGKYIASFVGFAEASSIGVKRNLVLMVAIDEPHANSIYGGTLAAPVFSRIMQRTLYQLSTQREIGGHFETPKLRESAPAAELRQVAWRP